MQVEEAHVKPGVAGAGDAEEAVGIGLVIAAHAAHAVDKVGKLLDAEVVQSGILGVGADKAGRALGHCGLEIL